MADNLKVSEADFTAIKENLKAYLKDQSQFADYNFEGAAISVLLDILAYNTHLNAAHANLVFAESFLDSAVLRGSVVSRAKELGYTPRSKAAAAASIRISFVVSGNPAQYVIPKNTKFSSTAGGTTYIFVTKEDVIIQNSSNTFTTDLIVYQGKFTSFQYVVDTSNAAQRFIVPTKDADTDFLTVNFKANGEVSTWSPWSSSDELTLGELDDTAEVWFLKEAYDELFEVYFGDGVVGKALVNNNVVSLEYLITNGKDANGARSFALSSTLSGVSSVSVTTLDIAAGGADRESIDSIKFLAPFYHAADGRAVTEDDYKAIIKNKYADVDDVSVWGGERNNPPYYGKVFIAIKPIVGGILSATTKEAIQSDIIAKYNVVTIRPEIVDPDYTQVSINTVITYNGRLFNPTSNIDLSAIVQTAIETFFLDSANRFGQPLYFSKLVKAIDESSALILNSITNYTLEKQKEIFSGITGTYVFEFNNAIAPGSVKSNLFTITGVNWRIKDIPNTTVPPTSGTLAIYRMDGQSIVYLTQNTGTVNYATGEISINNLLIDSVVDEPTLGLLKLQISPGITPDTTNPDVVYLDDNIYTNERDQIITLKVDSIVITLIPDNSV